MKPWLYLISGLLLLSACSNDESGPPPPSGPSLPDHAHILITVLSSLDSAAVAGAEVSLNSAITNAPVGAAASGTDGRCAFESDTGSYFVRIAAQGYYALPPQGVSPVPFGARGADTIRKVYYLDTLGSTAGTGSITGRVRSDSSEQWKGLASVLVLAQDSATGGRYSTASAVDGRFTLFNLPAGVYALYAYIAGYTMADTPRTVLTDAAAADTLLLRPVSGGTLSGSISFLSAQNASELDVTLLDSATLSAIPGLSALMNSSRAYLIDKIPAGRYLAWASYGNDGYVMDPDWIFKSGYPMIAFAQSDTVHSLNFSVTDAITILAPTNPADSLYPVLVDTASPRFIWTKYSSTKEYIVEVLDMNGRVVWGGYNRSDSTVRHAQISKDDSSAVFNFDGTATAGLAPGRVYRWKVYADNDAAPKVQGLISSSEDLRGLFMVRP